MNSKVGLIKKNIEYIKDAMENGVPAMSIARDLNVKYDTLKNNLKKLGVELKTNQSRRGMQKWECRKSAVEYLESSYIQNSKLCQKLIEDGIKEYRCEKCKRDEYENEKIPLELHHINCNHYDNRLENLMVVCPTCHAIIHRTINNNKKSEKKINKKTTIKIKTDIKQKPYKARIKHKNSHIPPKEDLLERFKELKNILQVGKYYGVSDNAVRKWLKKYELPYHTKNLKELLLKKGK